MSSKNLKVGYSLQGKNIHYTIESILGQGSFGVTYKAKGYTTIQGAFGEVAVELPNPLAIKEFFMRDINQRNEDGSIIGLTEGSMAYNYAKKFRQEAERLAKMDHPNIVKVLDFIEANNTFYYVMEFIDGEDINHFLKKNPISVKMCTSIIKDVANAVIYMHEQHQMLHLDLKPGNIMRCSSNGHIYLIDFGLSKHYSDEGQPDTSTTIGLGTEGYAPLEQGKRSQVNNTFLPTIDVYALGGTYFKMLTGETPPAASDVLDDDNLLNSIMNNHNVPVEVREIVIKSMMPSTKKRTQNVGDFISQLNALILDDEQTMNDEINIVQEETLFMSDAVTDEKLIKKENFVLVDDEETEYAEPTRFEQVSSDEWVDLGLSVKWNQKNFGALNLKDFGMLYGFGSINVSQIEMENLSNSKWNKMPDNISESEYDIVSTSTHDGRIPTRREWKELIDRCHWVWAEIDGVRGYRVIARNGNSIFLPATGKGVSGGTTSKLMGYYQSSNKATTYQTSWYLYFNSVDYDLCYESFKVQRAIRAVK